MSKEIKEVQESSETVEELNKNIAELERNNRILSQLSNDRINRISQLEIEVATYKTLNNN